MTKKKVTHCNFLKSEDLRFIVITFISRRKHCLSIYADISATLYKKGYLLSLIVEDGLGSSYAAI